jgi:hypothetical protein
MVHDLVGKLKGGTRCGQMLDYVLPFNVEADACNWTAIGAIVSDHSIVAQRLRLRHVTDFQ